MSDEKGQDSAKDNKSEKPVEQKPDFFQSKLFRLITVGLYLGGVGGLGFTLALYYLFIWESKMPELPVLKKNVI